MIDRGAFAKLMELALKKAGETAPIVVDEKAFTVSIGGRVMDLAHAFRRYQAAAEKERVNILRTYAALHRSWPELRGEAWDDARPRLIPRVLSRARASIERLKTKDAPEPIERRIGDHLVARVARSEGERVRDLEASKAKAWGVEPGAIHAAALETLRASSAEPFSSPRRGVYVSPWSDGLDAARLSFPDLARRVSVRGAPVAIAPHEGLLAITGSDDDAGLLTLAAMAGSKPPKGRAELSPAPLILDETVWVTWTPTSTAARDAFRELELAWLARAYQDQRAALGAGAQLEVRPHGRTRAPTTFCTWRETRPGLLPRAERVIFERNGGAAACVVPWPEVEQTLGELLKPRADLWPPRFEVERFPTEKELEAMDDDTGAI